MVIVDFREREPFKVVYVHVHVHVHVHFFYMCMSCVGSTTRETTENRLVCDKAL